MIQTDDYIEFDFKSLFFYVLRKWKVLLIFCVVAALLLGGFMTVSAYQESKNSASSVSEDEVQYYRDQIGFYDGSIKVILEQMAITQEYTEQSVLMNADYRNVYKAITIYNVETDYQIIPDSTYQNTDKTYSVTWYYRQLLNEYAVFEEAGAAFGLEVKYLQELVKIEGLKDFSFSITVTHPSEETSRGIMEFFQTKVQEYSTHLNETFEPHTLTQMVNTCGQYVDQSISDEQWHIYNLLLDLQEDLTELEENKADCQKQLNALLASGEPQMPNLPATFVKWFVLGAVIGIVLAVLLLLVKSLVSNRLHSAGQLMSCYQATVLGETVRSKRNLPAVIRWINRLEGCLEKDSKGNLQFLAENIRNHCGEAKTVLLCSDTDMKLVAGLVEDLNKHLTDVRLVAAGNILRDAEALRLLNQSDAVVMVAQRDVSRNALIKKMLHLTQSYDKTVLGFIVSY